MSEALHWHPYTTCSGDFARTAPAHGCARKRSPPEAPPHDWDLYSRPASPFACAMRHALTPVACIPPRTCGPPSPAGGRLRRARTKTFTHACAFPACSLRAQGTARHTLLASGRGRSTCASGGGPLLVVPRVGPALEWRAMSSPRTQHAMLAASFAAKRRSRCGCEPREAAATLSLRLAVGSGSPTHHSDLPG